MDHCAQNGRRQTPQDQHLQLRPWRISRPTTKKNARVTKARAFFHFHCATWPLQAAGFSRGCPDTGNASVDNWLACTASDIRAVRIKEGKIVDLVATPHDEREVR